MLQDIQANLLEVANLLHVTDLPIDRRILEPSSRSTLVQQVLISLIELFFGVLAAAVSMLSPSIVYNIADFVEKIGFVLSCWPVCVCARILQDNSCVFVCGNNTLVIIIILY